MSLESKLVEPSHLNSASINCPGCKTLINWNSQSPYRPFCSERCKNKDFVSWANAEHVLKGNSLYDGVLSEDIPLE